MSAAAGAINPPKVKAAWTSAPLRSLCEFHNGLWKGKKGPFETATVIRNTNFTLDGRIDLSDVAVLEVDARQLAKRRLQKNDIIIEKSGGGPKQPVGRVVLFDLDVDEKYSFSNFTSAIRVVKPSEIDPAFLHRVLYWWYTSGRTEAIQSHSTGIRNLDFNAYKDLVVPLPPLEEQKRIVAILDKAFAALDRARALAEANLADAQELRENTLESVFRALVRPDWIMPLANAVHSECKLSYGIVQPGDDVDGGLPIVRPVDLKTRVITLNTLKRIAPERAEGYARTQLVGGELLLCVRGSTGEVSVASESLAGCNVTRGIVPIRFDTTRVLPEFAFFQFRSRFVRDQIAAKTYGAALMQINIKDLRELDFVVPPVSEQRKAIARAEQFFDGGARLSENYQTQLTDLANLRQSLLQKAFSGQLT